MKKENKERRGRGLKEDEEEGSKRRKDVTKVEEKEKVEGREGKE